MELDLNELKRMAEEVQCWSNVSDAWANPDDEDQGVQMPTWIVGTIDDDDVHYDVAVVDCEQYSVPGESEKLAKFYAAANPAVVLELVRRLREAEARVAELEAELSDDHWPHGATVKLRRAGLGYFEKHGWAKRDSEGQLITVCSGASLDESMWEVVQELKVKPARGEG